MAEEPKVKILVGYHKPATLLKSDVFVPIHLGRALATEASKDGAMSQDDYQWMLDNMIGDDTGDNISNLNRELCEITALYWAWKNYEKLGNPEYIGFMHYRRFLSFSDKSFKINPASNWIEEDYLTQNNIKKYGLVDENIISSVKKYDVITTKKWDTKSTIYKQYANTSYLHEEDYKNACAKVIEKFPEYKSTIEMYNNSSSGWFTNMFILKKEIFIDYCQWLFSIIFDLLPCRYTDIEERRYIGHIVERLWGIYNLHMLKSSKYKYKELQSIFVKNTSLPKTVKFSDENEISIVMSSDNNYVPYLATTIQSVIENSSNKKQYCIYILNSNISSFNIKRINEMQQEHLKIKFINVKEYINSIDKDLFYTCAHFTEATYYRFFIPLIFKDFNRILYCDCDAVFKDDPAKLFNYDIQKYLLAAVLDYAVIISDYFYQDKYFSEILKLKNPMNYFQAGLLLMNLKYMRDYNFTKKCLQTLRKIKKPRFVDQCIMNIVCEDKVLYIDNKWNVENNLMIDSENELDIQLPQNFYKKYIEAINEPKFLHFSGTKKPWQYPDSYNSDLFWQYARKTLFYEEIIYKNTRTIISPITIIKESKFYKNFIQRIFSIKNLQIANKKFKVFTILGIKIKFKKKNKGQ